MPWPPRIGDPLPRATEAWSARSKLVEWVLGEKGHGDDWRRIFGVDVEDADLVWATIACAVQYRPIVAVRGRGANVSYGVLIDLVIDSRRAPVLTAWHYRDTSSAPRLVTAYPKLYTRKGGEDE